jgi:hypothetical protein
MPGYWFLYMFKEVSQWHIGFLSAVCRVVLKEQSEDGGRGQEPLRPFWLRVSRFWPGF